MKQRFIQRTLQTAMLCSVLAFSGCVKQGINEDQKLLSDEDAKLDYAEGGILLPLMMNRVVTTATGLQTSQNLMADSYAGYLESPTPFLNNVNTMTYFMVDGWMNAAWNGMTQGVLNQWLEIKNYGYDQKYPDLYAIALILKVFAGHRLVDQFGPYPYTAFGTGTNVQFDSEEAAYDAFFRELDFAVAALKAAETADPNADKVKFTRWDKSTLAGEYAQWIRLANTLRLRLAMRLSYVNASKAQLQAEKAAADAGGLLNTLPFSIIPVAANPYFTFNYNWTDCRLSAGIETFMRGFNDPRLAVYAVPATDAAAGGQVKGIRPGVAKANKNVYINYSTQNVTAASNIKVMDVAESFFLLAEGKLRGWNMNTARTVQQLYEDGVRASFTANGASGVDAYLQGTTTQAAYVDPKNTANNSAALTDITVKWDEAATAEKKLERIITQKWIAVFPEGQEGWSEFRRTGYPKMFPIRVTNNPDLPIGTYVKRYTYGTVVTSTNAAATAAAVSAHLNGRNSAAERIWWDVR